MIPPLRHRTWAPVGAALGASLVALHALVGALALDPLPAGSVARGVVAPVVPMAGPVGSAAREIPAAVDHDPFHPARRPPALPFRLPGEPLAPRIDVSATVPRLIGVAVVGGGPSFVLAAMNGGTPRLLRIGETLDGYRLTAVDPAGARFTGPDGRSQRILVSKAGL